MAVYTPIEPALAQHVLDTLAPGARLTALEALTQGSINTTYRVTVNGGERLYLRVNEGKPLAAIEREVQVVRTLARARLGVVTPQLLPKEGAAVLSLSVPGVGSRFVMLFQELPGDELQSAAVAPQHTAAVGAFLARAHAALRRLPGRSPNPFSNDVVAGWLKRLTGHPQLAGVGARLCVALERARTSRRPLPRGVIHGDLFVDNTRWEAGRLVGVFDWEMAGRDALMRDLAIALHAWCFAPGGYDAPRAAALLAGYQQVRPLARVERTGLFAEALSTAVRFCASRIRDFELRRDGDRAFLDYREFLARLDALEALGPRGFARLVAL